MHRLTPLILILLAAALTNCTANRVGEPFGRQPAVDDQQAMLGQELFMHHCHQCHPNGEGGLAPSLNGKPIPDFLINLQIRQGFGAMPAFPESHLSNNDLNALTNHVLALRATAQQP